MKRRTTTTAPSGASAPGSVLDQLPSVEELELRLEALEAETARVKTVLACLRGLRAAPRALDRLKADYQAADRPVTAASA